MCMVRNYSGTGPLSFVGRLSLSRRVHYERFHCTGGGGISSVVEGWGLIHETIYITIIHYAPDNIIKVYFSDPDKLEL